MSDSSEPPRRRDRRPPLPPEIDPRRPSPRAGRARYGDDSPGSGGRRSRRQPPNAPKSRSGKDTAGKFGKVALTVLSALVLVASGVTYVTYKSFNGGILRLDAIPGHNGKDVDGKDTNILLVGNDSRVGATKEQLAALGTESDGGGTNTDTMILVHIPADGKKATVVSFPRDLWVNIPGLGNSKLNAAYGFGSKGGDSAEAHAKGAQSLIKTLDGLTGLQIDHYVEVNLLGFYNITKAINGIEVNLCKPAKDRFSAINLPAGKQTIEGQQALAFVRQRHGLPGGDLDRIKRQQYFIGAVVRKMTSNGVLLNPAKIKNLLGAVQDSLQMDKGLEPLDLAQQMQDLAAGNVEFLTVPNKGPGEINGRDVVLPQDESAMHGFFSSLSAQKNKKKSNGSAPNPKVLVPHNDVSVQVLNGTTTAGLASQTSAELESENFQVLGIGNTTLESTTTIRYSSVDEAKAQTLATVIPGVKLEKNEALDGRVQLILGSDFSGTKGSSSGGSSGNSAGGGIGAGQNSSPSPAPKPDSTAADTGCIN